jgi:two-component system response regulator FlrC
MNDVARVLVVEDDDTLREALCDTITFGGYQAVAAGDGVEALTHMERESVDMVISDVQMDRMDGHRLLREVRSRQPSLPFVMITAHGSVRDAVAAMRDGATDYLLKPFEAQVLLDMVARMEPVRAAGDFIAEDPASRRLCALAERVADSDATILIAGESGSGKEVLARYLHHALRARRCAVPGHQLRGNTREHARVDAVRLREGRLHGGLPVARRQVRAGERRHPAAR